ncbi:ubiquitin associated protein 2 like [Rhinolophus ferrumequinum]|uniref:Ubiquitin associated protein 2 like n=1 Tax=Rhinolophus ferrumequinum TaxID=59479 RepID=A0A7J7T0X9_RHIFE|nr:ubiquitin associated protein 2 like [Rhinolophus ferrumequinum]
MMTSVGTNRARGNWEQPQNQNQTQHKQRPQATAEQIRLAQMISDHNDADFEEKVKQLIDITGKNQDECVIALHDCNGDVIRAINVLLEGNPDTHSWEMVGKKKGVSGQKDGGQTESNEEENIHPLTSISGRQRANLAQGRGLCFVCVYKFALKSYFRNQTTEESLLSWGHGLRGLGK